MSNNYVDLICERLEKDKEAFREEYLASGNGIVTRHLAIDNLLPEELALELHSKFPASNTMRSWSDIREKKFTTRNMDDVQPQLYEISAALQDQKVISIVEYITGITNQLADNSFYAGGLSAMELGSFLGPHIDNSHDRGRNVYRRINLLYYISPDWKEAYGGNLELWDNSVKNRVVIPSLFNRLILMETTNTSWHSVNKVEHDGRRCCVSSYFFTKESPLDHEYFHITRFSGRPEQKILKIILWFDTIARTAVRKVIKGGLSKKDVHIKQ